MSVAGLEPAQPASLAQYLCQFGYTDRSFGRSRRSRTFATWSQATDTSVIRHPDDETGRIPIIKEDSTEQPVSIADLKTECNQSLATSRGVEPLSPA